MSEELEEKVHDVEDAMAAFEGAFAKLMSGASLAEEEKETERREPLLDDFSLQAVCEKIKSGQFKKIVVMAGAGISTSAGIPDFRTPGTGLYHNLSKYDLPHPSSIFELDYFRENPKPFYMLAKELYPSNFKPTYCHFFIRLLQEKGLLLRHYTQNIDTLEREAGIDPELLVEAHGSFGEAHCVDCLGEVAASDVKEAAFADVIPHCSYCKGLIKPNIIFFGERLPSRFHDLLEEDFPSADLLIVLGTSLKVEPFASCIDRVGPECIRLLVNREKVGVYSEWDPMTRMMMGKVGDGFLFDEPQKNWRDVFAAGSCDAVLEEMVAVLGWESEMEKLMAPEESKN
jgi:NAD+-dependent protein deacetylase sirtuin 2